MSFCVTRDWNLQHNVLKFLFNEDCKVDTKRDSESVGSILSNSNYAWIVNNCRLVVINCKNGSRVGSWDFGSTLQDDKAEILRIDELQRPHGKEPLLVISINCVTYGGIVCVFDFIGSKVIRAIQFDEQLSTLHVIHGGLDLFSLSGPLRNFDGIFAVGTVGGNVYIVDICRQFCYEGLGALRARDELNPCPLQVVTTHNLLDIENHKKNALKNESHLAIHLNVVHDRSTDHFVLKAPSGLDKVHVNKQEVLISALHYCPQLGSILVGYNFGAYQLWDLMSMKLIYTSPICEDHIPITKFAIQEPADDPRAFCYIWAVYSSEEPEPSLLPYLVMYALCYESKEFQEGNGFLYENFQYCAVRFHMELGFNSNQSFVNSKGGKCLRMESITHRTSIFNSEVFMNDTTEDVLSLSVIIWKVVTECRSLVYMALFDLNQWYKEQMPNSPNVRDCSSYMITICVTDLIDNTEDKVLDVVISSKTLQQFMGAQKLEEHYYPSALSFDSHCLLDKKFVSIQYQGLQKALLYQLQSAGPLCLIRPTETYQEIISQGLLPLCVEISSCSPITSLNFQRQVILSVALEQQLISWLCKCASEWANGSFTSAGCSLELLSSWAFDRATVLKKTCDYLCIPLFDHSEVRLDGNTTKILNDCIRQIKNITFFYSFIIRTISNATSSKELIDQCHILQMIEIYFEVLQWLLNVGLLPEYTLSNAHGIIPEEKIRAPYPSDELAKYYGKRRAELQLAQKQHFLSKSSVLFIDNMINIECGGVQLGAEWKNDGGDGLYPPRSLQALLRTYLIDEIEVSNKHAVVIYLFLDLAMILDTNKYSSVITHLIKFPAVFKVCPSLIKITQAFWQLDHGDFSTAMELLLDPLVNQDDLKYWHHKVALKSLLVQEQYNSALLYMNVKRPPIIDDEDVLCVLSLFISNSMLDEAFYLEKHYKNCFAPKKFIKHLFAECSKYGCLNNIIYRNLSDDEEELFLQYLDEIKHPDAADLKITYFVQRSHYMEAFKTYKECDDDPVRKGLISQSKLKVRDQIVHSYKKLLPTVSYKFIESCTREPNPGLWKEVTRPEPMSVSVKKVDEKAEYKSSIILAALVKAKQTFNGGLHNLTSMINSTTEELPFLRTPTQVQSRKRLSVQVIVPKVLLEEEEDGPSPKKKPRWSKNFIPDRTLQSTPEKCSSILITPIVARKTLSADEKPGRELISTPTSILKSNSFVSRRKSISRASTVRFDVPTSSLSDDPSSTNTNRSSREKARTPDLNDSTSFLSSTKSSSRSSLSKNESNSEDVFFSPNSSLHNVADIPKDESTEIHTNTSFNDESMSHTYVEQKKKYNKNNETEEPTGKISPIKPATISEAKLIRLVDYNLSSSSKEDVSDSSTRETLKGRKTYKRLSSISAIRSSPRLSKNIEIYDSVKATRDRQLNRKSSKVENDKSTLSPESDKREGDINKTPVMTAKLKPRKSLSNKLLKTHGFIRSENDHALRTSVFLSEIKDISMTKDDQTSKSTYSRHEYSDVYSKELSTPEKCTEKHTLQKSFSSTRELNFQVDDNSSSNDSETVASHSSNLEIYDSPVEELVQDSSERQHQAENEKKEMLLLSFEESKNPLRRSSKRLSVKQCSIFNNTSQSPTIARRTKTTDTQDASLIRIKEGTSNDPIVSSELFLDESSCSNTQAPLKFDAKLKPRKSLTRQVLVTNAIARLTSEYSCTNVDTILSDSSDTKPVNYIKTTESPVVVPSENSDVKVNRLSLSDSFLEEIGFGQSKNEKQLVHSRKAQSVQKVDFNYVKQVTNEQKESMNEIIDMEIEEVHKMEKSNRLQLLSSDTPTLHYNRTVESLSGACYEIPIVEASSLSLSDSFLEEIGFSRSKNEKQILHPRKVQSAEKEDESEHIKPIKPVTNEEKECMNESIGKKIEEMHKLEKINKLQLISSDTQTVHYNKTGESLSVIYSQSHGVEPNSLSFSDSFLKEISFGRSKNKKELRRTPQAEPVQKEDDYKYAKQVTNEQKESMNETMDMKIEQVDKKEKSNELLLPLDRHMVHYNKSGMSLSDDCSENHNIEADRLTLSDSLLEESSICQLKSENEFREKNDCEYGKQVTNESINEIITKPIDESEKTKKILSGIHRSEGEAVENNYEDKLQMQEITMDKGLVNRQLPTCNTIQPDTEMKSLANSEDLLSKNSILDEEEEVGGSDVASGFTNMLQDDPSLPVLERNILDHEESEISGDATSNENECRKFSDNVPKKIETFTSDERSDIASAEYHKEDRQEKLTIEIKNEKAAESELLSDGQQKKLLTKVSDSPPKKMIGKDDANYSLEKKCVDNLEKNEQYENLTQLGESCSHTIGNDSEKNVEIMSPSRRLTRRSSKLFAERENPTSLDPNVHSENNENTDNTRAEECVEKEGQLRSTRSNRLRLSVDPVSPSSINLKVKLPSVKSGPASKNFKTYSRKRTKSVDEPSLEKIEKKIECGKAGSMKRITRSASTEYFSSAHEVETYEVNNREIIESYALARRLTRRQANIMGSTLKGELTSNEDLKVLNIEGLPHQREDDSHEISPTSSGISASVSEKCRPVRRLSRTSSNVSDSSSALSTCSAPVRTRRTMDLKHSPNVQGLDQYRSASADVEGTSIKKRLRVKEKKVASGDSSTSQTSSVKSKSSVKSYGTSTKGKKKIVSSKSHLPEIKEENTELLSDSTIIRKSGRKRERN